MLSLKSRRTGRRNHLRYGGEAHHQRAHRCCDRLRPRQEGRAKHPRVRPGRRNLRRNSSHHRQRCLRGEIFVVHVQGTTIVKASITAVPVCCCTVLQQLAFFFIAKCVIIRMLFGVALRSTRCGLLARIEGCCLTYCNCCGNPGVTRQLLKKLVIFRSPGYYVLAYTTSKINTPSGAGNQR